MSAPIPTLSATGWVDEPFKKADTILGHYFVSEESQSNFYLGNIKSLPGTVRSYGSDPDQLARYIQSNVTALFNSYFNDNSPDTVISIKVTADTSTDSTISRYTIKLDASVTIKGVFYSLGKIVDIENSTVKKIFNINNG